jgi:phospholipid-translocating ATPase
MNFLYQAIFNLALTTIPIFVLGLVEQRTSLKELEKNPRYYRGISRNAMLSAGEFAKWTLLGIWHSFNCYFMPFLLFYFNNSNLNEMGLVSWGRGVERTF